MGSVSYLFAFPVAVDYRLIHMDESMRDEELEQMLRDARERVMAMIAEMRLVNRDSLSLEGQAEHDTTMRQLEMLVRLTDSEVLEAIREAVAHTGRELTPDEVLAVLMPPQ